MSWMQLLAVSKSIDAVPDRPSPYRMRRKNLLPKFGGNAAAGTSPAAEPAGELDLFRAAEPAVAPAEPAVAPALPSAPPPSSLPAPEPAQVRSTPVRPGPRRIWRFWPRNSRRVRSGGGEPFQPELGLEAVRVVRNDLAGDDLMVVPRHKPERPGLWDRLVDWIWSLRG